MGDDDTGDTEVRFWGKKRANLTPSSLPSRYSPTCVTRSSHHPVMGHGVTCEFPSLSREKKKKIEPPFTKSSGATHCELQCYFDTSYTTTSSTVPLSLSLSYRYCTNERRGYISLIPMINQSRSQSREEQRIEDRLQNFIKICL